MNPFQFFWNYITSFWTYPILYNIFSVVLIVSIPCWFIIGTNHYKQQENVQKAQTSVVQESEVVKRKIDAVTKSLRIAIVADLQGSIPVAHGIQERIKNNKFEYDPELFSSIYSPTVELPSRADAAILRSEVQSALVDYRLRLSECIKHRQNYLDKLRAKSQKNLSASLIIYGVGLDSVIVFGKNLLLTLDKYYPDREYSYPAIPEYHSIQPLLNTINKPKIIIKE